MEPAAAPLASSLDDIIARACARIAPTWPLDRFIAVNPLWGMVDQPLPEIAATLRSRSGATLLPARTWYRDAYRAGQLRDHHLEAARARRAGSRSLAELRALLAEAPPELGTCARVVDVVDAGRDLAHHVSWRTFVTNSISQFCAAYFDDGQAGLRPPQRDGLYATWRHQARDDHSPALLMGLRAYRAEARALPATAHELIATALTALAIPASEHERYLWSLLLDQNGWASWCAYRRWTARLGGEDDDAIVELLAIRLAWEWILFRTGGDAVARRWPHAIAGWATIDAAASAARADDWVFQDALEIAWREPVMRGLVAGASAPRPTHASVQAVFCIDVRSEIFRRALEAAAPSVQTLGFAGFFGVPIAYQPAGAPSARPHLPGLLAPRLRAADTGLTDAAIAHRARHLESVADEHALKTDPLAMFGFVEALGLAYAGNLVRESLGRGAARELDRVGLSRATDAQRKPRLMAAIDGDAIDVDARADLAARMLRAMSLTRDHARLVMLAGHGSTSRNNPHAAGLDCGACGGQSGEVSARVAAALLNDPAVRQGLATRGIAISPATWFVAALHDTTTDDVALFDLDELPASHRDDLAALRAWLATAGERARAERAPRLGLGDLTPGERDRAIRARTTDWAQVRPEWGLANNAALIVAPRERCRHLDLAGRVFLHEYRHAEDEHGAVLELIMTAPMVVAHWINFQYYASTVDNARYGSGTKVLHNVVGGHLGVFEGNGGDLRIGLPLQSLHDGTRWVHEPLRLSVFIEAPRPAIDAVLAAHPTVRALVANAWIALFQLGVDGIHEHRDGAWVPQS